jgi:hypothetical protein
MPTIIPGGNESVVFHWGGAGSAATVNLVVGFDESADHPSEALNDGNMINAGYKYDVLVTSADVGTASSGALSTIETEMFNQGRMTSGSVVRVTKGGGATVVYLNPSVYLVDVPNVGDGENTKVNIRFTAVGKTRTNVNTISV